MDFKEIKDIIAREGGKFIIVEHDKPVMVIMGFEEYKRKSEGFEGKEGASEYAQEGQRQASQGFAPAESWQQKREAHPEPAAREHAASLPQRSASGRGDLTIDDLPL